MEKRASKAQRAARKTVLNNNSCIAAESVRVCVWRKPPAKFSFSCYKTPIMLFYMHPFFSFHLVLVLHPMASHHSLPLLASSLRISPPDHPIGVLELAENGPLCSDVLEHLLYKQALLIMTTSITPCDIPLSLSLTHKHTHKRPDNIRAAFSTTSSPSSSF